MKSYSYNLLCFLVTISETFSTSKNADAFIIIDKIYIFFARYNLCNLKDISLKKFPPDFILITLFAEFVKDSL